MFHLPRDELRQARPQLLRELRHLPVQRGHVPDVQGRVALRHRVPLALRGPQPVVQRGNLGEDRASALLARGQVRLQLSQPRLKPVNGALRGRESPCVAVGSLGDAQQVAHLSHAPTEVGNELSPVAPQVPAALDLELQRLNAPVREVVAVLVEAEQARRPLVLDVLLKLLEQDP